MIFGNHLGHCRVHMQMHVISSSVVLFSAPCSTTLPGLFQRQCMGFGLRNWLFRCCSGRCDEANVHSYLALHEGASRGGASAQRPPKRGCDSNSDTSWFSNRTKSCFEESMQELQLQIIPGS